jgi:low molecular weight protein-tyrosine phosphatase
MSSGVTGRLGALARLVRSASARHDAVHEWRRRRRGEPPLPEGRIRRVVVLCHGNICRSPFAEVLLAARVPALEVRSAGLHAGDGNPADPSAIACARRMGVSLAAHRSARVSGELLGWADLILVMQGSHVAALARGWPQVAGRVRLLGDFLAAPPHALPDPWGEADEVFDRVFASVRAAVERLAARIEGKEADASRPTRSEPKASEAQ